MSYKNGTYQKINGSLSSGGARAPVPPPLAADPGGEMDDSKNGGVEMNLRNFGGSKLFPKNWRKYAKIPYFSMFFTEIWGMVNFFLEKNGWANIFRKKYGWRRRITEKLGGGDGLLKKWGGVGMRGRSPREPAHPSSGCFWKTPLLALI